MYSKPQIHAETILTHARHPLQSFRVSYSAQNWRVFIHNIKNEQLNVTFPAAIQQGLQCFNSGSELAVGHFFE
jgi:hypothetical protein